MSRFQYGHEEWPLVPSRAFYDWIYCKMLQINREYGPVLRSYICFTDIEFNPTRSFNCQAYAVALYVSLDRMGLLDEALSSREAFLRYHPQDRVVLKPSNRQA